MEKNHPGEEELLPFERWLSKEELKRISEIVRGEEGRIYRSIQQESNSHPEKSEDSDKKISKGETVTIKVRFAIDHDFSKFLPLHGAVIRMTHAGKVPPGLAEWIAYGRLDEKRELKFISPVDDLKYQVQLLGKHDRFKIGLLKDINNSIPLASLFDQKEEINIRPDKTHDDAKFHISKAEANS